MKASSVSERLAEVVSTVVRPMAAQCDEESLFCGAAIRALAKAGLMGLPYPESMGGGGCSHECYVRCVEQLSGACAATGVTYATHVALACYPLFAFGTSTQKETFLRPMLTGEKLGAFALTEPEAGTDVASLSTVAERDGAFYVVNGHKIFITNAGRADTYILFARTEEAGPEGISAFIVSREDAGLVISAPQRKMGICAAQTGELFFRNLCIPADRILGRAGDGFRIAMETLDGGRLGIAAQAVGIASAAVEESCRRLRSRRQFGRALEHFQGLRWKVADMWARTEAARQLVLHAARLRDAGQPFRTEASAAKLIASETAVFCASEAVQICGGSGYLKGSAAERLYRDAKITQIYEGTSEVQRMVIASSILGHGPGQLQDDAGT